MCTYYCYEVGADCRIVARHDIEAAEDADAVAAAWNLLKEQEGYCGFEVWVRNRLVFESRMAQAS